MSIKNSFEQATKDIQKLNKRPDNSMLLELYALFKQSTEGDVKGNRPGFLDPKGRAKFDAWSSKKGLSTEHAMEAYTCLVHELLKT